MLINLFEVRDISGTFRRLLGGKPTSLLLALLFVASSGASDQKAPQIREHLRRAAEAVGRQDWQVAAREYEEALRLDSGDAETHARLGVAYQNLGNLHKGVKSLEQALKLNPQLPRVPILLSLNYITLGRYAEAVPYLEKVFAQETDPAMRSLAGQRLAECYLTLGNEEKGLATIQKLRQLDSNDPAVLYLAARFYGKMWNDVVQRMLEKVPNSYQFHQVLAETLEAQHKFPEAAEEYRKIVKMDPQLPEAHYRLGRAVLRANPSAGAEEAMREFQRELEISPFHIRAHVEIGNLHVQANQLEEAARYYLRALDLQPSSVEPRVALAKLLIAQKRYQTALEHLQRALQAAPEDEAVHYNLMVAHRGLGHTVQAQQALKKLQELKQQKQNFLSILEEGKAAVPPGSNRE